jgi:competence protein ComGF
MEPVAHYGIRKNEEDIKIQIKWTNGKIKTVSINELNQTITLKQK